MLSNSNEFFDGENVDEVKVEETVDEVIEKVEPLTVSPIVVAEVKPEAVSEEQKSNGTATSTTENSNTAIVTVQTSPNNTLLIAPVEELTKTEVLLKNLEITAETITAAPVSVEPIKETNIALTISTAVKIENETVKTTKRNLITPNSIEILV